MEIDKISWTYNSTYFCQQCQCHPFTGGKNEKLRIRGKKKKGGSKTEENDIKNGGKRP